MDNYAQLLSDYQKIRAEMEKFKKDRLDLFLKSVPDSFGVKLCEFDDESIKDFSQDMLSILCRWEKSRKKTKYREQVKKQKEQKTQKVEMEQNDTNDDEDISIADMLKDL